MHRTPETMSATEAERLITEDYANKFVAFVNLCEADCYPIVISRETALGMVRCAAVHSATVTAFYNESCSTLCIG